MKNIYLTEGDVPSLKACMGNGKDSGSKATTSTGTSTDNMDITGDEYTIPSHADFIIAKSTVPGLYHR